MARYKDIKNNRFGKLTAISFEYTKNEKSFWKCRCDCGNEKIVRADHLISGHTQSCGCITKTEHKATHITHNKSNTKLYAIWCSIKQRCFYKKSSNYKNYGGRGISICDEWKENFKTFYDWSINNGYKEGLSIDRIDVNGNYCPENCRWATITEQANNKRNNIQIEFNGVKKTISYWAKETGLSRETIYKRIYKGWNTKDALTKQKMLNQFSISK